MDIVKGATVHETIQSLKKVCRYTGYSEIIMSENGAPFVPWELKHSI